MSQNDPTRAREPQPNDSPVTTEHRDGAHVIRVDLSSVLGFTRSGPAWLALWVEESGELSFDANFCSPHVCEALRLEAARSEHRAEVLVEGTEALRDVHGLLAELDPMDSRFEGFLLPWDRQPVVPDEHASELADRVWPELARALVPRLAPHALRVTSAAGGSTYVYDALVRHPLLTAVFEKAPVLGVLAVGKAWVAPAARAMRDTSPRFRLGAVADAILLHGPSVPAALKLYPFPSPPTFAQWLRRVPVSRLVLPPYIDREQHWPDVVHAVHRACDELQPDAFDGLRTPRQWYAFHAACLADPQASRLVLADPEWAIAVLDERYRAIDRRYRYSYGTEHDWRNAVQLEFERVRQAHDIGDISLADHARLGDALRAVDACFAVLEQRDRDALQAAVLTSVPLPPPEVREHAWGKWRLRWIESTAGLAELRHTPPRVRMPHLDEAAAAGQVIVYELEARSPIRSSRAGAAVFRPDGRLLDLRTTPFYQSEIVWEEIEEALRAARVRQRRARGG